MAASQWQGPGDRIPLAVPSITEADREAIARALVAEAIVHGPELSAFEAAMSQRLDGLATFAVNTGTAALHLCLLVAGVGAGDDVVMPSFTYVATANAVRHAGAAPVFVDVERDYRQLDVARAEAFIADQYVEREGAWRHRDTGRRLAAILPVDLLGHPCDVEAAMELGDRYDVPVVADSAQAFGATLRGRPAGSIADYSAFSFNANKIMTTAGGGVVVCRSEEAAERARSLAWHARLPEDGGPGGLAPHPYDHHSVGFNYLLPTIHAALGLSQLERMDEFLAAKRRTAERYAAGLASRADVTLPGEAPEAEATFWLYTVHVDPELRDALMAALAADAIDCRPAYLPMHLVAAHRSSLADDCPVSEYLGASGICLPCSTWISDEEIDFVTDRLSTALDRA